MSTRLADWMIYIEYAGTNNRFRLTQSVTMVYDEKKAIDQWNNIITNKLKEERLEKNRDVTRVHRSTNKSQFDLYHTCIISMYTCSSRFKPIIIHQY